MFMYHTPAEIAVKRIMTFEDMPLRSLSRGCLKKERLTLE
jgi:hypothetical protein